ncbi:MAG: gliding motility lipoprotein GldH [Bacteroidales bacterium]|nr:gliding motility lipoprotein GldH [Bacteroidales bacterium]MDD3430788.1 gliding motility lipoprotein GldH [Bacteroidales bacterium]MDD4361376.1 gliding motility lipoprotein GldH [Bacteroidales bacterium]MDD4431537.1 gliding motility lipoprotein GldH [Bacteroidales bacterium]
MSALILMFSACREHNLYHEFQALAQWNRAEVLCFEDSLDFSQGQPENLVINIYLRNDNSYPYTNLCLNAAIFLPDTSYYEYIDVSLIKENGKWAGSGWGSLYTQEIFTKKLPVVNSFRIELSHAMQDEVLTGIRNIGICLRTE